MSITLNEFREDALQTIEEKKWLRRTMMATSLVSPLITAKPLNSAGIHTASPPHYSRSSTRVADETSKLMKLTGDKKQKALAFEKKYNAGKPAHQRRPNPYLQ